MASFVRHFAARRAEKANTYNDGLIFDTLRHMLPEPHRFGRYLLMLSFVLQSVIVLLGFLQHHHRKPDFSCCNAWAIFVAMLFIAVQWTYYNDWCSKLGAQAHWHRANMFVPFFVFSIMFVMWLGGVLSLLAHTQHDPATGQNIEFFEMSWKKLSSVEVLSFIVMTCSFVVIVFNYVAQAVALRNNLGMHYYAPGEGEVSIVHLRAEPEPQNGSFNYRNILGFIARVAGVETSLGAEANILKVMAIGCAAQIPFYLFAGIAYGQDNKSALLMACIVIGLLVFLASAQVFRHGIDRRQRRTRKWNRAHMFFPLYVMFMVIWTYFFTCSTVFFQVPDPNMMWEDILLSSDMTPAEKALFAVSVINLLLLLAVQLLIANLHRKAWAEGTALMDDGLLYGPPDDQGRPTRSAAGGKEKGADNYALVGAESMEDSKPVRGMQPSSSRVQFKDDEPASRSDHDDDDDDEDVEEA